MDLLDAAGMRVHKPNPRQLKASIPSLPKLTVLFQRAGDIVVSVRDGSVDFGITGRDVVAERSGANGQILIMLPELGFGFCTLNVIVPEEQDSVRNVSAIHRWQEELGHPLRVATKFPNLTKAFFKRAGLEHIRLISAEGTLEIAPTIGYADLIVDLVSTGTTLRDNRLRVLDDGLILESQACLIANRTVLKDSPEALGIARQLLEFISAHKRAADNVVISANMRWESPERIAERMFGKSVIGGLLGPTISPVITRDQSDSAWHAVNIVVRKEQLAQAIVELREIGGSCVIVSPVSYIFEEEPQAYSDLLAALEE